MKNIHLSDFKDGTEHKILGTGNLNLKEFIENLNNENYDGFLIIELDFDNKRRNNINSNEEAIFEIQKSIDFINNIIK